MTAKKTTYRSWLLSPLHRAERAHHEAIGYERWWADHFFMFAPAQFIAKTFMETFREFPPRQKAGSFSIEAADSMLTEATTSGR